jgi:heme/copper-type cytochrome/quinol oxidase subunit 4
MNKYKFWGIVAAVATVLTVFGAWAKLTHKANADTILTVGLCLFGVSQAVYHYLKFMALKNKKDQ